MQMLAKCEMVWVSATLALPVHQAIRPGVLLSSWACPRPNEHDICAPWGHVSPQPTFPTQAMPELMTISTTACPGLTGFSLPFLNSCECSCGPWRGGNPWLCMAPGTQSSPGSARSGEHA
jgi:hypothetical protein